MSVESRRPMLPIDWSFCTSWINILQKQKTDVSCINRCKEASFIRFQKPGVKVVMRSQTVLETVNNILYETSVFFFSHLNNLEKYKLSRFSLNASCTCWRIKTLNSVIISWTTNTELFLRLIILVFPRPLCVFFSRASVRIYKSAFSCIPTLYTCVNLIANKKDSTQDLNSGMPGYATCRPEE